MPDGYLQDVRQSALCKIGLPSANSMHSFRRAYCEVGRQSSLKISYFTACRILHSRRYEVFHNLSQTPPFAKSFAARIRAYFQQEQQT
jgi:hypothetical protein